MKDKEKLIMVDNKEEIKVDLRRSFFGPDEDTAYYIDTPNAEAIRGADWQYSKIYTRCLSEGMATSAEMMDILKRRGIIGDDFDRRVEELTIKLNEAILRLSEATTSEDKASLALSVSQDRELLFQWNQRLSGPMSNTCEQIADDARLEYLTACIIQNEDGTRVWGHYDDFLTTRDQALSMKSRYEVMLFLQGYESDFLDSTPEAMAMREVESDIMKEAVKEVEKEKLVKKPTTKTKTKSIAKKTTSKKTKK
jgi:hypothetical protein